MSIVMCKCEACPTKKCYTIGTQATNRQHSCICAKKKNCFYIANWVEVTDPGEKMKILAETIDKV